MEETKEVLRIRNKEVEGRGKADAREVGRVAADAITRGYGSRNSMNKSKFNKFDHVKWRLFWDFEKIRWFPSISSLSSQC